jgi:hypothetical protein
MHEEVPKKEATVNPIRTLKKRHADRHLPIGRLGQPKKWTQDNGGSQKKLAATCRGTTHCAILHGIRDTVIRDKARKMLQEEPPTD